MEKESRVNEGQKWGVLKCCAFVGCIGAVFGGVEVGLVFALKARYPSLTSSQT